MATAFNTTLLVLGLSEAERFLRGEARSGGKVVYPQELLTWERVEEGKPGHEWQGKFLEQMPLVRDDLRLLLGHRAYAHVDPSEVNKWFAALPGKIPIRFEEGPVDPLLFCVGTYFGLWGLHWQGESQEVNPRDPNFPPYLLNGRPAYRLSATTNGVQFFDSGLGCDLPLVVIPTSDPRIKILAFKSSKFEEFELLGRVQILRQMIDGHSLDRWGGIILPNVLIEQEVPVGEGRIVGLNAEDYVERRVRVFEAGMFLRLVLCPEGPLAEGAAKVGFAKEAMQIDDDSRPDYPFDENFVFAFLDTRVESTPYAVAWVPTNEFSSEVITLAQFR